jgi:hypothetical protein
MSIYRVGGWVRDSLLGYEPKDNDYVVVGETAREFEEICRSYGFKIQAIGKSFPVYMDNHSTKAIRGALCHRCNTGIGMFRDNPGLLAIAIEYLQNRG